MHYALQTQKNYFDIKNELACYFVMIIIVKKSNLKEVTSDLKKKFESKEHNNGLKKHFGKLKRNLDGLTYQQQIISNED